MEWINEYMDAMTQVIEAHGGFVDDYSGDGIKANFGVPIRHQDALQVQRDAHRAVRCALAMGGALEKLNADWEFLSHLRDVGRAELGATGRTATTRRGGEGAEGPVGPFAGGSRLRIEVFGAGVSKSAGSSLTVGVLHTVGRDFAVEGGVSNRYIDDRRNDSIGYLATTDYSLSMWFGGRYYLPPARSSIRPFFRATAGLVTEYRNVYWPEQGYGGAESGFLVELDLGADIRLGSRLNLTAMLGRHGYSGQPGWSTRGSVGLGFTIGRPLTK